MATAILCVGGNLHASPHSPSLAGRVRPSQLPLPFRERPNDRYRHYWTFGLAIGQRPLTHSAGRSCPASRFLIADFREAIHRPAMTPFAQAKLILFIAGWCIGVAGWFYSTRFFLPMWATGFRKAQKHEGYKQKTLRATRCLLAPFYYVSQWAAWLSSREAGSDGSYPAGTQRPTSASEQ